MWEKTPQRLRGAGEGTSARPGEETRADPRTVAWQAAGRSAGVVRDTAPRRSTRGLYPIPPPDPGAGGKRESSGRLSRTGQPCPPGAAVLARSRRASSEPVGFTRT